MNESQTMIHNALGDKYEIKDLIQAGGMGKIFLGVHKALGKKVAIKVVHQELVKNEQFKARFYREAKLAASLEHPGIIDIYDFGTNDDFDYIIMPFIDGENFQARIKRLGPFEIKEAVRLMIEITEALAHAHERNVIHRDIKPSNIMFDSQGRTIITDFGISKDMGDNDLTAPNTVLGSPRFMSPEQIKGDPVDARSDLYSLGLVFYEMITGKHPFQGKDTSAIYYAQAHEVPPRPEAKAPEVSKILGDIIMRLLEKSPDKRYPDCLTLLKSLKNYQSAKPPITDDIDDATILDDATIMDSPASVEEATILDSTGAPAKPPLSAGGASGPVMAKASLMDMAKMYRKFIAIAGAGILIILIAIAFFSGDSTVEEIPVVASQDTKSPVATDEKLSDQDKTRSEHVSDDHIETAALTPLQQDVMQPPPQEIRPAKDIPVIERLRSIGDGRPARNIRVWTDKDRYRIGDNIHFYFQADEPSYVLILTYTTKKEIIQVFPNHFNSSQFIQPGREYSVPNERMNFDLKVTGPAGTDNLIALVSKRPFDLLGSSFSTDNPFLILDTKDASKASSVVQQIDSLKSQEILQKQATYLIQ